MRLAVCPRWQMAALFLACATLYAAVSYQSWGGTTGDEPHYLILAHSIAFDWDTDLANDHQPHIVKRYFGFSDTIDAHAASGRGGSGMRPLHLVGLSAGLAPVVWLGGSIIAARLAMVVVSALAAVQLWLLLEEAVGGPLLPRIVAWAAAALCVPMLIQAGQIFPDTVAPLALVVGLRVLRGRSMTALVVAALTAAILWWLHFRYAPFAALLALGVCARAGSARRAALPMAFIAAAEVLRWVLYWQWYGNISPIAPHYNFFGAFNAAGNVRVANLAKAYLSPGIGLLPFAPVMLLGCLGSAVAARRFGVWGWLVLAAAVAYSLELLTGDQAWSLPGRYTSVVVPLLAIALAALVTSYKRTLPLALLLLGWSLTTAALAARDFTVLYPSADDVAPVPLVRDTAWLWPQFTREELVVPAAMAPRNTGRLEDGRRAIAAPGDPPGALLFGPYIRLAAGTYVAEFRVAVEAEDESLVVGLLDVGVAPFPTILATRELRAADTPGGEFRTIAVPFDLDADATGLETRVLYGGLGTVKVSQVRVERTPDLRRADVGIAGLWAAAIAIGASGFGWAIGRRSTAAVLA